MEFKILRIKNLNDRGHLISDDFGVTLESLYLKQQIFWYTTL